MTEDLPPIAFLRAFSLAAETLSFKEVAAVLHLSPSAVSRQIQSLEAHLGAALFRRLNPGLELTPEGRQYLQSVHRVLGELRRAQDRLNAPRSGPLRVSALQSFTESWLVPHLANFERANPGIELRVEATPRYADFERDPVDVAIRFGTGPWADLHSEPIVDVTYFPVCSPTLLEGASRLREPAGLEDQTLIHLRQTPEAWRDWLRVAGLADLKPMRDVTYDYLSIALSAAEEGRGRRAERAIPLRATAGRKAPVHPVRPRGAITVDLSPRVSAGRARRPAHCGAARLAGCCAGVGLPPYRLRRAQSRVQRNRLRPRARCGTFASMKQLTCTGPGTVEWREVPEPRLVGDGDALVRPLAVARCDIDMPLTSGAFPIREPFALGHECVAEIVALGDGVRGLEIGQRAVVAFQLSCGTCGSCLAGHTANCDAYPVLSDFGVQPLSGVEHGGMLSDVVRVPHAQAMLAPVSPKLDPLALGSVSDNVLDGYRAVAPHLADLPGSEVLIVTHGLKSVPLYAALAAIALGAERVDFASNDDEVLEVAERLGARPIRTEFGKPERRYPLVVDAGLTPAGLQYAIRSTAPEGICQSVSFYAGGEMPLPLGRLYTWGSASRSAGRTRWHCCRRSCR